LWTLSLTVPASRTSTGKRRLGGARRDEGSEHGYRQILVWAPGSSRCLLARRHQWGTLLIERHSSFWALFIYPLRFRGFWQGEECIGIVYYGLVLLSRLISLFVYTVGSASQTRPRLRAREPGRAWRHPSSDYCVGAIPLAILPAIIERSVAPRKYKGSD